MEYHVNFTRYLVAGSLSLAIHAAILFVDDESKVFAMPAGNQSTSVSINFVAQPQAQVVQEQATKTPPPEKRANKPKPAKKEPQKVVQKKSLSKPVKDKPAPKIPTKSAQVQTPVKEAVTSSVENENSAESTPKTAAAPSSSGATNQPKLVDAPSFVTRPAPPVYPRLAQKRGIEGVAMYEVWLDENGRQIKQVLLSSSGAALLDESALNAIKQWKFSPQVVNGEKIAHRVQIPVRFKLEG
nr:energy transducer TonB [Vibrio anguillarum]CAD43041.1 TonB protein [Vibrio anguillarum serovar O1]